MAREDAELSVKSSNVSIAAVEYFRNAGVFEDGAESGGATLAECVAAAPNDIEDVNQSRCFAVSINCNLNEADVAVAAQARTFEINRDAEARRSTQTFLQSSRGKSR
jgi:hypothetical protein